MARIRWAKEADADFDLHSAGFRREAAAHDAAAWLGAILGWMEQLSDFPLIGTPRDDHAEGVRTRAFRKPVVIAYAVDLQGDVAVLRLFSRGRDIAAAGFGDPE